MTSYLRIAESGWSTTIQDLGRPGFQRLGIPVSGALDSVSLQAANALVGNPPGTAAIEVCYVGPTIVAEAESVRLAVVGATAQLDILPYAAASRGAPGVAEQSFRLNRGEALKIGPLKSGSVLYVAIEGGFDIPAVLGSRSTDVRCALGGWEGRSLEPGDYLPLNLGRALDRPERKLSWVRPATREPIRVILGPQSTYFSPAATETFLGGTFVVSSQSNRMGMRLTGPRIEHLKGFNIVSDALTFGSIQIMGSGQPIVMMPDRPTTGGYPKIATVISADLPRIGRAAIGSQLSFAAVSVAEAETAWRVHLEALRDLIATAPKPDRLDQALLSENLVSGFISAHFDEFQPSS